MIAVHNRSRQHRADSKGRVAAFAPDAGAAA
jgi:hypothetical protein